MVRMLYESIYVQWIMKTRTCADSALCSCSLGLEKSLVLNCNPLYTCNLTLIIESAEALQFRSRQSTYTIDHFLLFPAA